mmetsp:Transcript_11825/g.37646  ORF Transcript_11825/g.37646 Transcript_11825/m.37646 type:complete len:220 (-) Transcript_11825:890-1549(-)
MRHVGRERCAGPGRGLSRSTPGVRPFTLVARRVSRGRRSGRITGGVGVACARRGEDVTRGWRQRGTEGRVGRRVGAVLPSLRRGSSEKKRGDSGGGRTWATQVGGAAQMGGWMEPLKLQLRVLVELGRSSPPSDGRSERRWWPGRSGRGKACSGERARERGRERKISSEKRGATCCATSCGDGAGCLAGWRWRVLSGRLSCRVDSHDRDFEARRRDSRR